MSKVKSSKRTGFLVFDDTVTDKNYSRDRIGSPSVQWQCSYCHQRHRGCHLCLRQSRFDQFWIIDYRIYDPDGDGKTKLDHVQDMLLNCVHQKQLQFWAVLMDSWYATKEIMLAIENGQNLLLPAQG